MTFSDAALPKQKSAYMISKPEIKREHKRMLRQLKNALLRFYRWNHKISKNLTLNIDHKNTITVGIYPDVNTFIEIGIQDDYPTGAMDWWLHAINMMGYEAQVNRLTFNPEKQRMVLDPYWSGAFWRKDVKEEHEVDVASGMYETPYAALTALFVMIVQRERRRRFGRKLKSLGREISSRFKKQAPAF